MTNNTYFLILKHNLERKMSNSQSNRRAKHLTHKYYLKSYKLKNFFDFPFHCYSNIDYERTIFILNIDGNKYFLKTFKKQGLKTTSQLNQRGNHKTTLILITTSLH